MRVGLDVHTLGQRQTGNETYIRELLAGLAAIGDPDIDFVCYHTAPPPAVPVGRRQLLWPRMPLIRVPVSFPLALGRDRVDVAHFQYVSPPVAPCPVVLTVHDVSFEAHPEFLPPLQTARMRWLVPQSIRRAAHTVTISNFTRQQIIERYRIHQDRITVTPAAAGPAFRWLPDRDALRARLATFDLPERYILAVGNLQPRKNLSTLLDAYAALRRSGRIDHALVLVGQVHYRGQAVFSHIDRLGIRDHVKWTGYVTEETLVGLYNLAEVFVFPTLYEGFGLPIVEAMACGAPVVSTNVASIPEVSGDAAVLVDPKSAAELSSAIEMVATTREMRIQMRERGFRQAARFNWQTTAAQMIDVFKRCAC